MAQMSQQFSFRRRSTTSSRSNTPSRPPETRTHCVTKASASQLNGHHEKVLMKKVLIAKVLLQENKASLDYISPLLNPTNLTICSRAMYSMSIHQRRAVRTTVSPIFFFRTFIFFLGRTFPMAPTHGYNLNWM